MQYLVHPSSLSGMINIPPSKSHTMRAILFATLAKGKSVIRNYLPSPDTAAMISACRLLGAKIQVFENRLEILGVSGKPKTPSNIIDAGNSGQVLRFIGAVSALTEDYTVITGDHSICHNRPVQPLLEGLNNLGAFAVSSRNTGYAPMIIKGPLKSGVARINGEDSQPVSGLLIASSFIKGKTEIYVENPGEKPWIDLTLDWFKRLGISCINNNYMHYVLEGKSHIEGFEYDVPGDFSSAAFPIVAALITHSEVTLQNIDMNDVQGDKAIIPILEKRGAVFELDTDNRLLHVKKSGQLLGGEIDVNDCIDAVTILAVLACFSKSETRITAAAIARKKECDRLSCIQTELSKMNADIILDNDELIIKPSRLSGTKVQSYNDHRMAMSLAVAGLATNSLTIIENSECVSKSFPGYIEAMQRLSANIEETS